MGYWRDVPQISVNDGDSHDVEMELKGNGVLNIQDDALVIAYLQASEVLIGLTPKEHNHIMHRVKWFKWESNPFLQVWVDG